MTLAPGTRLGCYEVLSPVGVGGMGEVYRARDLKLDRFVAVKVLPETLAKDAQALGRFEREAKAVAALSHPNIMAIHDFGNENGTAFAAMELLEGKTLREWIADGRVPLRKVVAWAREIAVGLAAAHARGIVHRDLKPENVFVTKEGHVKLLDFGLAKRLVPPIGDITTARTVQRTEPGMVVGTVSYMSPEQVEGKDVDHRSDIFSFGLVLYEMLTGQVAFVRPSAVETMHAILKEEPDPAPLALMAVPPPIEQVLRHCLEKDPDARFQSARDLVFHLQTLSNASGEGTISAPRVRAVPAPRLGTWLGAAAVLLTVAGGVLAAHALARRPAVVSQRITFRRGILLSARFAPDGRTVLYGARWQDAPVEVHESRLESPESRSLGVAGASLLAVSRKGDLALVMNQPIVAPGRPGTLALASVAGGAPREVANGVTFADWAPDGTLAIVRSGAKERLESPPGTLLWEIAGWLTHPRFSPDGKRIAFLEHPSRGDDRGTVALYDLRTKEHRTLSRTYSSAWGLAWAPGGREIWFTASDGSDNKLRALTLSGGERLIYGETGRLVLHDVDATGRVLLARDQKVVGVSALVPPGRAERDLSWLDMSVVTGMSRHGEFVVFSETGEGSGPRYATYLRKTDGSPAVRLGDGATGVLSADDRWVVTIVPGPPQEVKLLPTGIGEARTAAGLEGLTVLGAGLFPDGKDLLVLANEPGRAARLFRVGLDSGKRKEFAAEGVSIDSPFPRLFSPDGTRLFLREPDRTLGIHSATGELLRAVAGFSPQDLPVGWTPDGNGIFVCERMDVEARIVRIDLSTGAREPWRDLTAADTAGLANPGFSVDVSADGTAYAHTISRVLSQLYVLDGLR